MLTKRGSANPARSRMAFYQVRWATMFAEMSNSNIQPNRWGVHIDKQLLMETTTNQRHCYLLIIQWIRNDFDFKLRTTIFVRTLSNEVVWNVAIFFRIDIALHTHSELVFSTELLWKYSATLWLNDKRFTSCNLAILQTFLSKAQLLHFHTRLILALELSCSLPLEW